MSTVGQKILKSPGKKLVKTNKSFFSSEIAFLAVLNFFLVQKLIFGHFRNCTKWIFVKFFFREIDLFDFTSFFAWTFLIFCPTEKCLVSQKNN